MGKLDRATVAIVVAHEFEDIELLYPIIRLSEEGAKIIVDALPPGTAAHFHTRPYFADKPATGRFESTVPLVVLEEGKRYVIRAVTELRPDDFGAIMFSGGFSPDFLRINPPPLQLVADAYNAGKVIAAICHGPQVLISVDRRHCIDMVRGRNVTRYAAVEDNLRNAGGEYIDTGAIRVGSVVTGRCPNDFPEFCHEVGEAILGARARA